MFCFPIYIYIYKFYYYYFFAITFSDLKTWPIWGDPNKKRFDPK